MSNSNYGQFRAPSLNTEVFNESRFLGIPGRPGDPSVGEVMSLLNQSAADVLARLDVRRSQIWLTAELDATPERMARLQSLGLVTRVRQWTWLWQWRRTEKGAAYCRIWFYEMGRRDRTSPRGLSWLPGEEPQPGDTVITSADIHANITRGGGVAPSLAKGMFSGARVVPHDRRARDVVYEEPADMVAALGLLEEGNPVSIQYLVGANEAEGATEERMVAIMEILEGRGCAVREGHGWVRTPMGTRWHQTWSGQPGSAI
jgi:hypothetical protein